MDRTIDQIVGFVLILALSFGAYYYFGKDGTILTLGSVIVIIFAKAAIKKAGKTFAKTLAKKVWRRCCEEEVDAWLGQVSALFARKWTILWVVLCSCTAGTLVFIASFIYVRKGSSDIGGLLWRLVDDYLVNLIAASAAASFERIFPIIERASGRTAGFLARCHEGLFRWTLRRLARRRGKTFDLLRRIVLRRRKEKVGVAQRPLRKTTLSPENLRPAA